MEAGREKEMKSQTTKEFSFFDVTQNQYFSKNIRL